MNKSAIRIMLNENSITSEGDYDDLDSRSNLDYLFTKSNLQESIS